MDHLSPDYPVFYPQRIRRIVPWYEDLIQVVVSAATHISETRRCNCRTIVELGLGDGYLAQKLLEASPQSRVLALEISPHVCQAVRQRLSAYGQANRFQVLNQDINRLSELKPPLKCNYQTENADCYAYTDESGFQLKCCRVIICSLLLHDIKPEKQLEFLTSCGKILSPTGSMVLADPMLTGSDFMDEILITDWVNAMLAKGFPKEEVEGLRQDDPRMFKALNEEDMVRLFYKAGFASVRTIWRHCNFTVVIASKQKY